jgi:hypothetical protein
MLERSAHRWRFSYRLTPSLNKSSSIEFIDLSIFCDVWPRPLQGEKLSLLVRAGY